MFIRVYNTCFTSFWLFWMFVAVSKIRILKLLCLFVCNCSYIRWCWASVQSRLTTFISHPQLPFRAINPCLDVSRCLEQTWVHYRFGCEGGGGCFTRVEWRGQREWAGYSLGQDLGSSWLYLGVYLLNPKGFFVLKIYIKPWVTLTPTRETHDPLPWVGVLSGRVRVGLVDPRVTRGNP